VQGFVGALAGRGATKGVLITTSAFTSEARTYAERVQARVVLVDGRELARLMIDVGVGVSVARRYDVKRVDLDYFAGDGVVAPASGSEAP
jgi:restriction system protein